MKKFQTICLVLITLVSANAQVTDSFFVANPVKQYLYTTLPNGFMFTATGEEVDFQKFVKSKQKFPGKPTLYLTWTNRYCPPCLRIIDTIFNINLQDKFNIVLINKDQAKDADPPTDKISLINKISDAHPNFNKKIISLFDSHNILNSIDDATAPMLIWMDGDFNICGTVMGYQITVQNIKDILQQITYKKIVASKVKYLDNKFLPSGMANAAYTLFTEVLNGVHTFYWNNTATKENYYKLNFTKNSKGYFAYHPVSKKINKAEDLYNENEIVNVINQTLNSLTANNLMALKEKSENEYWSGTTLKLKNFGIRMYDTGKKPSLLGLMQVKIEFKSISAKFDKKFNKKSADFDVIAKYIETTLQKKPGIEKTDGYDSKTYTYFYNKDVQIILKEDWSNVIFEIIVQKDKQANIPINANKQATLISIYNENKLCDDIKKIEKELLKNDKSRILGFKNEKGNYKSLIEIENFRGTIYEGRNYFKYKGYINNNAFDEGIYLKEFDLITAQLQTCIKIQPIKNTILGTEYSFIAKDMVVTIGLNSKQHNMWIEITVMK